MHLETMLPLPYPPLSIRGKRMELESRALEVLQRIGIRLGQRVLDFGCGSGTYTIPAAKIVGEQGRVYALDKDNEALGELMKKAESAALKNIERIKTSGELEIELTDGSVDVVLLFDVFHSYYFPHSGNRRKLLNEIYRILKRGGVLVLTTGNVESPLARLQRGNWRMLIPPIHLSHFSPSTIKYLLQSCRLELVEQASALPYEFLLKKFGLLDLCKKLNLSDKMLVYAKKIV